MICCPEETEQIHISLILEMEKISSIIMILQTGEMTGLYSGKGSKQRMWNCAETDMTLYSGIRQPVIR